MSVCHEIGTWACVMPAGTAQETVRADKRLGWWVFARKERITRRCSMRTASFSGAVNAMLQSGELY